MEELEISRLAKCEEVIDRGLHTFVDVGNALLEIRDSRLYRETYSTFEDYCKERWGWARNYANKLIASAEVVSNLGTIVPILPMAESQARPLTSLSPDIQREAWQQVIDTAPESGITARHVQAVVDEIQHKPHVLSNSGENEWYTPPKYIEAARRAMGSIDTDPASCELANSIVKAKVYFDIDDDGLSREWVGNVWLNPPYVQPLVSQFTAATIEKYLAGEINQACVLVNNATETNFFQYMLQYCSAICFPSGRIRYIDKNGEQANSPLQGQAILYFGNAPEEFTYSFKDIGGILYANR